MIKIIKAVAFLLFNVCCKCSTSFNNNYYFRTSFCRRLFNSSWYSLASFSCCWRTLSSHSSASFRSLSSCSSLSRFFSSNWEKMLKIRQFFFKCYKLALFMFTISFKINRQSLLYDTRWRQNDYTCFSIILWVSSALFNFRAFSAACSGSSFAIPRPRACVLRIDRCVSKFLNTEIKVSKSLSCKNTGSNLGEATSQIRYKRKRH